MAVSKGFSLQKGSGRVLLCQLKLDRKMKYDSEEQRCLSQNDVWMSGNI